MTAPRTLQTSGGARFRTRLFVAMMLVVAAITATVLYFAQRSVEADVERNLQREFQSEIGSLLALQDVRRAVLAERCRALVRSSRIHAAIEENALDHLYPDAQNELRDVLGDGTDSSPDFRAKFFRFLDAKGVVIPPPSSESAGEVAAEGTPLALAGVPDEAQAGFIVEKAGDGRESIAEVIAMPMFSGETGDAIAAIVLGFKPIAFAAKRADAEFKSGLWLDGRLHLPSLAKPVATALGGELARVVTGPADSERNFTALVDGVPHLLFYKLLNSGSRFPPAYEVCLYSLAEARTRQRQLRWEIVGAGALVLLAGLAASHFVSTRLARPVENLEVVSASNVVQRERAEEALENTHGELLARNSELHAAITELKTAQQQIIQQERLRALGQMASGIAHDFNNALVPILGFCELLLISPAILADKHKATSYLETIQTAAKDAASVVSRLREFYRPDKSDRAFEPVHLKRLVEQAITLTKPKWKDQAQAAGATIEIALELEAVPPVAGEESALREVLTNLIFNAVDAMPGGGTLTLRTRTRGDSAVLEVGDTGTGMSEEVRKHCLEPFFSTKGERGTGLGLSMVFGIVQRHSGSIDLRSAPGKGTTFIITLPLQNAAPDSTASAAPVVRKPQRALRVLVVDDEAPVRETLAAILCVEGHEAEFAKDGAEGLDCFGAGQFDLVITDKAMPSMSGDQMAAAIKQRSPKTPIILLTGFGLFHEKGDFPDVDVLTSKPIRIPALRDAIATAMETV